MAAAPKRRGRKKGMGLKIDLQPAIAEDDSAMPTDVHPSSLASLAAAGAEAARRSPLGCQALTSTLPRPQDNWMI